VSTGNRQFAAGMSRRGFIRAAGLATGALVLAGCGAASSTPPEQSVAASPKAGASGATNVDAPILSTLSGSERDRVAGLIQVAQKEGELSWLDAVVVPDTAAKFADAFKQRYGLPNAKINFERQNTGQVTSRVQEEVKGGKVTVDLFAVASPRLFYALKDADALLQYDSPEYAHYESSKKAGLTFEPGYWMSPVAYTFAPITNPKFFDKPIKSWNDMVDPKLQGKILISDAGGSEAPLYIYVGLRKVLPLSLFQQLAALGATVNGASSVQGSQRLATGEVWIAEDLPSRLVQTVKQTGVPLKPFYPDEGNVMLGHPYGIPAKAPHPNLAKLFLDFVFSEQGQTMYVSLEGLASGRDGVKFPDEVKQYSPPLGEIKTIALDFKNLDNKTLEAARAEWQQVFKR
jgi:iron(III) transport system substrate-binding protein